VGFEYRTHGPSRFRASAVPAGRKHPLACGTGFSVFSRFDTVTVCFVLALSDTNNNTRRQQYGQSWNFGFHESLLGTFSFGPSESFDFAVGHRNQTIIVNNNETFLFLYGIAEPCLVP
jgi:hypothetical protein